MGSGSGWGALGLSGAVAVALLVGCGGPATATPPVERTSTLPALTWGAPSVPDLGSVGRLAAAAGPGGFVLAVGLEDAEDPLAPQDVRILHSPDGLTWTEAPVRGLTVETGAGPLEVQGVAGGPTGGVLALSMDGWRWTTAADGTPAPVLADDAKVLVGSGRVIIAGTRPVQAVADGTTHTTWQLVIDAAVPAS